MGRTKKSRRKNTMEVTKLDGVRCNKLCRNTAPIATTNNGDLIHYVVMGAGIGQEKQRGTKMCHKREITKGKRSN
jgi:hypothetical protein